VEAIKVESGTVSAGMNGKKTCWQVIRMYAIILSNRKIGVIMKE